MYPVTDAFLAALASPSQRVATRVVAVDGDGNTTTLRATGGSVTMDAGRAIIRTCSVRLTETETLTLQEVFDLIMTPGIEVRVERGLLVGGSAELVPLGLFSTDNASFSRRVTGEINYTGSDRSKKIARARFTSPYQIAAGSNLATAITTLLQSRYAPTQVDFSNVTGTTNAAIVWEAGPSSDPWREARTLMSDYGFDLNFDGDGIARAQVVPDPATTPAAFSFGAGETNLVLDATVSGTLERTYNGVIASGEGSGVTTPVRAVVWDTDPASPTYYLSGFGQAPYFYTSPQLTTVAQCEVAAATILARVKGRAQGLAWTSIVNPALEPLDVVTTTLRGVTSTVVIDQLTIPLDARGEARAVARETAVAA